MTLLAVERETLDRFLPGLRDRLDAIPFDDREVRRNPCLRLFREAGGAGLLVPERHHGRGATALDAVRVQRAVGAISPSLAVATCMHHFSVAALAAMAVAGTTGLEWLLLQGVAEANLLVSSGFAEGRPGQHILHPTMSGRRTEGGLLLSGTKRPCSLTWSMDLMSASVRVPAQTGADGDGERVAVLLIPAGSPGIERSEFWGSPILAGAESDQVVLTDVFVPDRMVIYPEIADLSRDPVNARGFVWFEMLVAASYLGVASRLAEKVVLAGRAPAADRAALGIELEGAMYALERLALSLDAEADVPANTKTTGDELARALLVRFSVQDSVERVAMRAGALVGGMAFAGSAEVGYLIAACRALAYHPPSLASAVDPLAAHLAGTGDFSLEPGATPGQTVPGPTGRGADARA